MHHHNLQRPLTLWARLLPRHTRQRTARPPTARTVSSFSFPSSPSPSPSPHRQNSLRASYYRGGTSRAVFFRASDLPPNKSEWTAAFLGVLGSPDPLHGRQLDGLGGGISSLSKVCVVGAPSSDAADVDYTFAAVGVRDDGVDFSSNCGNMSAAVGPFAVDCGMVRVRRGGEEGQEEGEGESEVVRDVTVHIHNTNTGKMIHATFPVIVGKNNEALAYGDCAIDGVAGAGAPVRLDFIRPAGSRTGKLLPTGAVVDTFDLGEGGGDISIRATCVDVANPCCFVAAADLGVEGRITPSEMEERPGLLGTLERVRRLAGVRMGLAGAVGDVPGSVPKIAIVSPPCEGEGKGGSMVVARAMSVGQPHKAIPVTVALALAAAAKLPGSVVSECVGGEPGGEGLVIHHASGTLRVDAQYDGDGELKEATVFRTARRLMEGRVFWK